ncbi:MAG TPA: aryl-sulfate sulfotransferase [Candidatus Aquilonibacter sp.]|nr:aryl-sulfate sulfotransferase [Candidatus Aquilonibacter sp.]
MKALPTLVTISLLLCALMAGCGAGSIPSNIDGTVTGTQNPLVALYTIRTGCFGQVMVEFGPTTSYGRNTAWVPVTTPYYTSLEVAGMRASTTYHMRAQVQCSGGSTSTSPDKTFRTGPLPASPVFFPKLVVSRPNPSLSSTENPGIEYISVQDHDTPAYYTDRDGNVIWYYYTGAGNIAFPFKLLPDGNVLLSITNAKTFSNLREVDLAGNTIREMTTPDLQHKMANAGSFDFIPFGFTHDFALLPNGHVVVIVNVYKNFTNLPGYPGTLLVTGDALVDLDQNWNPVWGWNSFDYLDVNRYVDGLPDWTHSNALLYSPNDGNLILSMRNQSWILKIDYENGTGSGNVLWHLGYQGDFALTDEGVPSDEPSLWFSLQHFPIVLSQNGPVTTLGIFDNGNERVFTPNGAICSSNNIGSPLCYSRPVIFQVDESTMVANIAWADPLQYFGQWGGALNRFPNGNVEFELNAPLYPPVPDLASYIQEVTGTSPPQVVWQMNFFPAEAFAYRAYRVPSLYNGVTWQY